VESCDISYTGEESQRAEKPVFISSQAGPYHCQVHDNPTLHNWPTSRHPGRATGATTLTRAIRRRSLMRKVLSDFLGIAKSQRLSTNLKDIFSAIGCVFATRAVHLAKVACA
jgi:hypothetical protein